MQLELYFRKHNVDYVYGILMKNVQSNKDNEFASGFIKCINKYQTPEDFEVGWQELVSRYGVQQ